MHRKYLIALSVLVLVCSALAQQPPRIRTLSEQELMDMMLGSSIQAGRSSDTPSTIGPLKEALAHGKKFTMISVDDLPDNWMTVTPADVGGGGAWDYVRERIDQQKLATVPDSAVLAIRALSKYLGKPFNAVIRVEADGATLDALMAAADMNLPVVDACLSGRARPEIEQQIPWINGISSTPASMVTQWGDTMILEKAVDDYRSEDISRAVAVASEGDVMMAMNPMSGSEVKRGVIKGALTRAILYGRTAREAVDQGKDPVAALVKATNGFKLFQGVVTKSEMKNDRGFTWWNVELEGRNEYSGHTYKVFVKNENIVAWLDGVPDAMSPDTIQNLDPKTGDAYNGGDLGGYRVGAEVAFIGYETSPMWRTPKGIEVLGPRHFGFNFDYVPIEQLQEERKLKIGQ